MLRLRDHVDFDITDDGATPMEIWSMTPTGGAIEVIGGKNYLKITSAESVIRRTLLVGGGFHGEGVGRKRRAIAGILRVSGSTYDPAVGTTETLILRPINPGNQLTIGVISTTKWQIGWANTSGTKITSLRPTGGLNVDQDYWVEAILQERNGVIETQIRIDGTIVWPATGTWQTGGTAWDVAGNDPVYLDFKSAVGAGKGVAAKVWWRNVYAFDGDYGTWSWPPTSGAEANIVRYILLPNDDGNLAQWTASGGGSVYALVDDFPAVVGTDNIQETTLGESHDFAYGNLTLGASEEIYTVFPTFFQPTSQTDGTRLVRPIVTHAPGTMQRGHPLWYPPGVTDAQRWNGYAMDVTPQSRRLWKESDVDALVAGVTAEKVSGTSQVDALAVYVFAKAVARPALGTGAWLK